MLTINYSVTGVGTSPIISPDFFKDVFNVGLQAIVTGTATYSVLYTLDEVLASGYTYASNTADWAPVSAAFTAATASQWGQLLIPCRGILLSVTAGTGTVNWTVCQAGTR